MFLLTACVAKPAPETANVQIEGTWRLLSSEHTVNDSTVRNDPAGTTMIKIINGSHFAFMLHDERVAGDTLTPRTFSAGGGRYTLDKDQYTEHLDYCSARNYEGNDFTFTVTIHGDTLIQTGVEKLKTLGIGEHDVPLVEKYVRVNP
ncbi:lipocalin-like domain-containing protein [Chryseolinea lacunae]|uniref:Lipocalin-like domain-containing protein n=1 Tax=Chryseolinea lacunae TaxID=2801331 RepID=A0ABS1L0L4_9BACT|nr:lipocalin-like domain-containing protein [Chryseolinea lacunae]MBL0745003.1 lipocalin-like domain-containing protein [Chryseolinea lacunae]